MLLVSCEATYILSDSYVTRVKGEQSQPSRDVPFPKVYCLIFTHQANKFTVATQTEGGDSHGLALIVP